LTVYVSTTKIGARFKNTKQKTKSRMRKSIHFTGVNMIQRIIRMQDGRERQWWKRQQHQFDDDEIYSSTTKRFYLQLNTNTQAGGKSVIIITFILNLIKKN
jgi:hypothetical protein